MPALLQNQLSIPCRSHSFNSSGQFLDHRLQMDSCLIKTDSCSPQFAWKFPLVEHGEATDRSIASASVSSYSQQPDFRSLYLVSSDLVFRSFSCRYRCQLILVVDWSWLSLPLLKRSSDNNVDRSIDRSLKQSGTQFTTEDCVPRTSFNVVVAHFNTVRNLPPRVVSLKC